MPPRAHARHKSGPAPYRIQNDELPDGLIWIYAVAGARRCSTFAGFWLEFACTAFIYASGMPSRSRPPTDDKIRQNGPTTIAVPRLIYSRRRAAPDDESFRIRMAVDGGGGVAGRQPHPRRRRRPLSVPAVHDLGPRVRARAGDRGRRRPRL